MNDLLQRYSEATLTSLGFISSSCSFAALASYVWLVGGLLVSLYV